MISQAGILSGGFKGRPPPHTDQNFLNFMQFLGKIWQICMLASPPGGMAPPPTGNPGSSPELLTYYLAIFCRELLENEGGMHPLRPLP